MAMKDNNFLVPVSTIYTNKGKCLIEWTTVWWIASEAAPNNHPHQVQASS